jgi:hypothetical protein
MGSSSISSTFIVVAMLKQLLASSFTNMVIQPSPHHVLDKQKDVESSFFSIINDRFMLLVFCLSGFHVGEKIDLHSSSKSGSS